MTLLAIDPSSTCTGFAVLSEKHELLDYGVWRPSPKDDPYVRIEKMCYSMGELLDATPVNHIVLEVTSGHTAARLKGSRPNLTIYGVAVGAFWTWLRLMEIGLQFHSHRVYENEWTDGVPKIKRHQLILAEFPEHAKAIGKRHDITDAIGLGLWWLAHRRILEADGMSDIGPMNDKKTTTILRKIGIRGCEVLAVVNELQGKGPVNFMIIKNHESLSRYSEKQIRISLKKLVRLGLTFK